MKLLIAIALVIPSFASAQHTPIPTDQRKEIKELATTLSLGTDTPTPKENVDYWLTADKKFLIICCKKGQNTNYWYFTCKRALFQVEHYDKTGLAQRIILSDSARYSFQRQSKDRYLTWYSEEVDDGIHHPRKLQDPVPLEETKPPHP